MQYTLWQRIILANEKTRQYKIKIASAKKYARKSQSEIKTEMKRVQTDEILKFQ